MKHRISAGAIIIEDDTVLLVNHMKPGYYDFWVPPGGGVLGTEDLESAARRELGEEAGLVAGPMKLAYIEEFYNPEERSCKFWFYSATSSGQLKTEQASIERESIVNAAFIHRSMLAELTVFPPIIREQLWEDLKREFPVPKYLGIRKMEFY